MSRCAVPFLPQMLCDADAPGCLAEDRRKENRIAAQRFEETRGHDIITNRRTQGIGAKPVYTSRGTKPSVSLCVGGCIGAVDGSVFPPSLLCPPQSVWSKVEMAEQRTRRTMSATHGPSGGGAAPKPASAPRPQSGASGPRVVSEAGSVRTGGFRH